MLRIYCRATIFVTVLLGSSISRAQESDSATIARGLKPLLEIASGRQDQFAMEGKVQFKIDQTTVPLQVRLARYDGAAFDLDVIHEKYSLRIRRRSEATALALPHHKTVFLGRGKTDNADHLSPKNVLERMVSPASHAALYLPLVSQADATATAHFFTSGLKAKINQETNQIQLGKVSFQLGNGQVLLELTAPGTSVYLRQVPVGQPEPVEEWVDYSVVLLERAELERQLVRGVRRATEVIAPGNDLTSPGEENRTVDHGELRWIDGHRVVLLQGGPEEIGQAHGKLLADEARRCVDSVLYSFGTVQTILTGRWFRHDLERAYSRLAPFIPDDHKLETRALAKSLQLDPELADALNVFPEMFHCSGFAVFGDATQGGKLYHGRVLDYMTTIGLQDAATTLIVAPRGKIPFANISYAGFVGSVSGMNAKAISLGEMGGRGEGRWDGVPMATLMRRALEECSTLEDVIQLWKTNPRTCEYYYVFADGKTRRAVGVAAVPESVELVLPGQSHPRLGDGIKDAVVLSAGSRLEELRMRVQKLYGNIDADAAQSLMCRPVAMQSNLHNVLFVPEDGVFYVANADHKQPAADRPYVRLDLNKLLDSMNRRE